MLTGSKRGWQVPAPAAAYGWIPSVPLCYRSPFGVCNLPMQSVCSVPGQQVVLYDTLKVTLALVPWCRDTFQCCTGSCDRSPVTVSLLHLPLTVYMERAGEDVLVLHSPVLLLLGTQLTQQLVWVSICFFHTGGEWYLSCLRRGYFLIISGLPGVWASLPASRKNQ